MKAEMVKIEDILAVMRAEGEEITEDFMAMAAVLIPAMEEMYNRGYADGMADGKAAIA